MPGYVNSDCSYDKDVDKENIVKGTRKFSLDI